MPKGNTLQDIAIELTKAFYPIQESFSSLDELTLFLKGFGWDISSLNTIPVALLNIKEQIDNFYLFLDSIFGAEELEISDIEQIINYVKSIFKLLKDLESGIDLPSQLIDQDFHIIFSRQLLDYIINNYLFSYKPLIGHFLGTFGIIRSAYHPDNGSRIAFSSSAFSFEEIPQMIDNPFIMFENAYGWGTIDFEPSKFFLHLESLLAILGLDVSVDQEKSSSVKKIQGDSGLFSSHSPISTLNFSIFDFNDGTNVLSTGLRLGKIPAFGQLKPGLILFPYLDGNLPNKIDIGDSLRFSFRGSLDTTGGLALILRSNEQLNILRGFQEGEDFLSAAGSLNMRLENVNNTGDPIILLGTSEGTSVYYNRISFAGGIVFNGEAELFVDLGMDDAKVVIKSGEDGFLSKILPPDGITSQFDLAVGISTTRGFYFRGGAGLEIKLPALKNLGPITISDFTLGMRPSEGKIPVQIGATIGAQIGPFGVTVENMGLKAIFSFPEEYDGNLGFLDLDIGFKPPNGLGLSFNTKSIKGGGYLYFNHEEKRYAGVAALSIKEKIALKAIGLLSTRMPDGSKGYSLLLVISAEFEAIQLGFGFKLTGVGGIIGAHRTMKLAQLRSGIKTGANDRLLFPANPLENAPQLISELRNVFPVEEDRFIFGLMGLIEWGTPTLITIKLGILIEVGSTVRAAILGVVKAALPDENNKLLFLQVAFLGTIEFEKGQIAFDASLFGSRLLKITLSGDMALRISWKNPKNFLLSVGGFHPKYQPSMQVNPKPLTINFLGGNNPRLTLTTYFAVTSNTVQFGAKAEIYIKVTKNLTAEGYFGFDLLIQFNPFFLSLLAYAYLGLKWKGKDKMSIDLKLSLEGPTPWEAEGEATVKILGIKFKVKASKTWGERRNTSLPKIAVLPQLRTALQTPANWTGKLPAGRQLVTLRKIDSLVGLVHPVGELHVSQKVLPLGLNIQKFGTQEVSDGGSYAISSFDIGTQNFPVTQHIKEDFTPNHFRKMSESQKLSSPSFVKYKGGAQLDAASELGVSYFVKRNIKYEYAIAGQEVEGTKPTRSEQEAVLQASVKGSAAGKSSLSFSIKKKTPFAPDEITINEERYAVVWRSDLSLYDNYADDAEDKNPLKDSYAEAIDHYGSLVKQDPSVKRTISVVPEFEIATL